MMLSGFLFDLRSMPAAIRAITYFLPARYFVALLQTIFLAGDVHGSGADRHADHAADTAAYGAVGIGLVVSSVVANMQQGMLYSFVILMPFTLLSGLTTPIENMPSALRFFTFANPLRYAIDIIHRGYLEGAGLGPLVPELWPLAVIATITLSAAAWMF